MILHERNRRRKEHNPGRYTYRSVRNNNMDEYEYESTVQGPLVLATVVLFCLDRCSIRTSFPSLILDSTKTNQTCPPILNVSTMS